MSDRNRTKILATAILGTGVCFSGVAAHGQQAQSGIVGKDGWLFSTWELATVEDMAPTNVTIDLISRFNKVLAANGVTMAVVIIPSRARVYSEFLPPSVRKTREMAGQYERVMKGFEKGRVNAIDLATPFLDPANRNGPLVLQHKLDSHWTPAGALLAAEAIKAGIAANPTLKSALDSTPAQQYKLEMSKSKKRSNLRDIIPQLSPADAAKQTSQSDEIRTFTAVRVKGALPHNSLPYYGVALVGSSSSRQFTGFLDGLVYNLQRDIYLSSTDGDRGAWVGMETYLRGDVFQTKPPKLMIWEQAEKQMPMPPTYKWRSATFNMDNTEWLLRVAALVQKNCTASTVTARLSNSKLTGRATNASTDGVSVSATTDNDFVEYSFSEPFRKLDYLSAHLTLSEAKTITLEAIGADGSTRKFSVPASVDAPLKFPLTSPGSGYTKVRIYPGKTTGFALKGLQICRQPDGLLS